MIPSLQALWEGKRLDGRGWMDTRDVDISFGTDWGSCQVGHLVPALDSNLVFTQVTLGKTRVLAQVSSQVTEPRLARYWTLSVIL